MIIPFHEFTEGFLDRRSSNDLVKHGGILVVEKLLITANDIIQDADGSGVFISVAKGIHANTLLRYDLESDAAEEVLRFEGEPNRLALSKDGSRLYVSFADSNRVRAFSSLDYRELYSVTVPTGKVVLDIDTSPVRTDEIAVVASRVHGTEVVRQTSDVEIFRGRKRLPSSYLYHFRISPMHRTGRPLDITNVAYGSNGMNVIATIRCCGTEATFANLTIGEIGITTIEEFSRDVVGEAVINNGRIYSSGSVYDEFSLGRYGKHQPRGPFALDFPGRRIFSAGSSRLYEVDLDSLHLVARYQVDLDGPKRLIAASDRLFALHDSGLSVIERDQLTEVMESDCQPLQRENSSGTEYVKLRCDVRHAIYDTYRNKLYAALGSRASGKGNSIAVLDPTTLLIESRIQLGMQPDRLALSATGSFLYVQSDQSEYIARIDLTNEAKTIDLSLVDEPRRAERRFPVSLYASPLEEEALVVARGVPSGCRLTDFLLMRDNQLTTEQLTLSDLEAYNPRLSCPRANAGFDTDGTFYVSTYGPGDGATIVSASVNEEGLSTVGGFSISAKSSSGNIESIYDGTLLNLWGGEIDLARMTVKQKFVKEDLSAGRVLDLVLDSEAQQVVFLVSPPGEYHSGRMIVTWRDLDTGDEIGSFELSESLYYSYSERALAVTPERITVAPQTGGTLFSIPRN